jgi:hypothetical protein
MEGPFIFLEILMTNHTPATTAAIETETATRLSVIELVASRYDAIEGGMRQLGSERPLFWDDRKEGLDIVRSASGEEVRLHSTYMQSPPKPGWVIVLTGGDRESGFTWTLYGITPQH